MRFAVIGVAVATVAAAQTVQVFHLTQDETPQQIEEIATTIRAVGSVPQVASDAGSKTISVSGDPAQIDVAGWLVKELDRTAPPSGMQQYRPAPEVDDIVQVFFLANPQTLQQLLEIATTVRAVGDIQRLFSYYTLRAVVVRGTGSQMAIAAWIVNQLDQPIGAPSPGPKLYKVTNNDVISFYNVTNPGTLQELQELVTMTRALADVGRIFVYNARKTIVARGPADRIALTTWVVQQLDRPAPPPATAEYELPNDAVDQVRMFYLAHNPTPQQLMSVATQIRTAARIQRLFVYKPLSALGVRGTPSEVATAEKILEEMGQAK